jgi:cellobiose epimerase
VGSDCTSGVCSGSVCQPATCNDSAKNGSETDTDCGGGICPGCAAGRLCSTGTDCAGGYCNSGTCRTPTCTDGAKNGNETDVDCGGGTCSPCVDGQICSVNADCQSGNCPDGTCHAATGCVVTPAARTLLTDVQSRLAFLTTDTANWWLTHGIDPTYGGFYGSLDAQGNSVSPRDKGLIQEARHLWAFSMYYERRSATPAVKAAADSTYQFIVSHLRDASDGEFFYKVNETGSSVLDNRKLLYAEGFAVYALAEYGRVFGVQQAKDYALACFLHFDARTHDTVYGGYDQRADPGWMSAGAEKETNTQIHLMEAFTELYEATGNATAGARLGEMIDVTIDHLLQPTNYVSKEFKLDWTPWGSTIVSYGHDLETAWLLMDAARAAGRDTEPRIIAAAIAMGAQSSFNGLDAATGGYFYEGVPNTTTVTNTEHVWWVEFESLSGNFRLYRLTCDPTYLTRLETTLDWLEARRDPTGGEWYWGHWPDGSMGPRGTLKGEEWKASYHDLRALVYSGDWISDALN